MSKLQNPPSFHPEVRGEFLLNREVDFLNHGSFGAVPRSVFEEQTRWRLRIEADPVEMLGRRGRELLTEAKTAIGDFLGINPQDFGLVNNATEGINAVLRSLALRPGDELVTTDHVYNAVRQAMKYAAARTRAHYREIELPLPVQSSDQIAERVLEQLTDRTRLLVVDHVTSPTALIFPVERIATECNRRGIDMLIDGAHAPGMLPLDIPRINATYYAGNLHKWVCAPRGSGFLWVHPKRQGDVHPLVISHDLGKGFATEFSWQGTRDISAWLSIPKAIEFGSQLGWERIQKHNHELAVWVQQMLCEKWDVEPISPIDGRLLGSMVTVALPQRLQTADAEPTASLQQSLYSDHHIEVPLFCFNGRTFARPCCQIYNTAEQYLRLGDTLLAIAA